MTLPSDLKKKFADFMAWIFEGRDSQKNHLEFQREVREQKREKAVAIAAAPTTTRSVAIKIGHRWRAPWRWNITIRWLP